MTRVKLLALVVCITGVALVSMQYQELEVSSGDGINRPSDFGLVWAFGFLVLYAAFMLLWGARVGRKFEACGRDVTLLMLGLVGVATLVLWWWPMLAIERLSRFPSSDQWLLVGSVALIAIFCNVTLMLATTASSPSFVAVGSVLQIPMSAASDYVLHGEALDGVSCVGYSLITLGFLLFTIKSHRGGSVTERRIGDGYGGDGRLLHGALSMAAGASCARSVHR